MFKIPEFDFLITAKKLITNYACCNSCLGRQFGNVLFGFTNLERGRAIKISLLIDWEITHRLNPSEISFPKSLPNWFTNCSYKGIDISGFAAC